MTDPRIQTFMEKERKQAKGQRLEMLERELHGTIKLLETAILPVFRSLEGFHLEYEFKSPTGYSYYADLFYEPLQTVFECDGFVPHGELLTRERFALERQRVRTMAMFGYRYLPFSWDELEKKGELCRRTVFELLGRFGKGTKAIQALSIQEREMLRLAAQGQSFRQRDAQIWLGLKNETVRKIIRRMLEKGWVAPDSKGESRIHSYKMTEQGWSLFRGHG
ncbi:hypothetical protein HGI30_05490 [Paenibacillus albicereus]|uniref:Uncharacterized protein n=1 Tax=Paenibacillus albicereus TaxID=2726185 RepID=A0A6H2GV71_9BACL|nr:hypothetical protein [Paenibacillus albicereus]QJC51066.1 hypothetical protein HGI30_05490 [Paenibacillus albicereus]